MNKYVFKSYNPIFKELFEKEELRLKKYLQGNYKIEHIGSTAVPNLGGKGIIDIMIAVPKDQMKESNLLIQKAGYEYVPESGSEKRMFFYQDLKDPLEEIRRYHIHLTFSESENFKNAIFLRDYLIKRPKVVEKYAKTKELSVKTAKGNREKYIKMKSSIINKIIKKVKMELN